MGRRTIETLIALAVIAVLFYALMVRVILVQDPVRPAPPHTFGPPQVRVRTLTPGLEWPPLQLSGNLIPRARLNLDAEIAGRVVEVLEEWHVGREVAAGELLFAVDPKPSELALASARARLVEAEAQQAAAQVEVRAAEDELPILKEALEVARRESARVENLSHTGESSLSTVDQARATAIQAQLALANGRAALARARAVLGSRKAALQTAGVALQEAEEALRHLGLRAPFRGVLTAAGPQVGTLLTPGNAALRGVSLGELVDLSELRMSAQVHESRWQQIVLGAHVSIEIPALGGLNLPGEVIGIAPQADPLTRNLTVEIRAEQPEDRPLPAGLFALARVTVQPPAAAGDFAIEREELLWREGVPIAFVVDRAAAQPLARPRELKLGPALGAGFTVQSGLATGETIVSWPLDRLDPQGPTEIEIQDP